MSSSGVGRLRVSGMVGLSLIAVAAAVLLLAGGSSTIDSAQAVGPDMALDATGAEISCMGDTCNAYTQASFQLVVTTNPAPGVAVAGYQTEIDFDGLIWNQKGTCAQEAPMTHSGGSPIPVCVRGTGPLGQARHATASGVVPPPPAMDITAGGSGETLLILNVQCSYQWGQHTVNLTAGGPYGAGYFDTNNNRVSVKSQGVSDSITVKCMVPPPPTSTPEQRKDTSLLVVGPDTVLQGDVVSVSGSANFRQDIDYDHIAGWGAAEVLFDYPAGLSEQSFSVSSGANAACMVNSTAPGQSSGGCAAIVDKGGSWPWPTGPESTDPVDYQLLLGCDEVGTHTVTVTTEFLRERGSAVPLSDVISNTASVNITCQPLEPPMLKAPPLSNLFLTRQGTKLAPTVCSDSTDAAVLSEVIGFPITSLDPKGSQATQDLAAFEFEVRFDNKLVCVNIEPGPAAANMECIVRDKDSSQLEGIAQIACFTVKGSEYPDTETEEGRHLADVIVRPQPELYSQIIANQENGIAVQILNQDCELADAQGHPIPIYSCEDADITIRMLEGDVDADCAVDAASDGQVLAFRWGAELGNLLYNARYDLEPAASPGGGGVNGDGDIDVKDIQFVFGRHGSTCADPNPPQPPINPKA